MKKMIVMLALVSITFANADEDIPVIPKCHRVFIEPDVSFGIMKKQQTIFGSIRSERQLYGIKVGYEYFKPNDIYTELNGYRSFGNVKTKEKNIWEGGGYYEGGTGRDGISGHLGYAFQYNKFIIAPFSGLGWGSWYEHSYSSKFAYIPFGLKAQYPVFGEIILIGLKYERIRYFYYWDKYKGSKWSGSIWRGNVGGYEISLPISFFVRGNQRGWHASIEPYFFRLEREFSIIGGRLAAIHQF